MGNFEELRSLPPPPSFSKASAKRRFIRLGRKSSDVSQSGLFSGSSSTCRRAEGSAIRQSSKSHILRQTSRLSGVFQRSPVPNSGSMALTAGLRPSRPVQLRKGSMICAEVLPEDDPSELSNQITAPGILKIFGNEICEGAHYKSVLATMHSSAKELVKEALDRYGLKKEESESFVLCDTIGSIDNHQWRTEGFRVVGDHEKPLLLQSLWKPREGLARRFEIQRKSSIEKKTSQEKDTITAGINAQARKLQKSRSRVTSTLLKRTMGQSQKLWRSKSEMDLLDGEAEGDARSKELCESYSSAQSHESLKTSPQQISIHSVAAPSEGGGGSGSNTETLCLSRPRGEREGEESEREETESSDDNTTQYSIHPPHDCPYLLLLRGCSLTQDFVVYLLATPHIVIGQQRDCEANSDVDILLFADDILPNHCLLHRHSIGSPITLSACRDAVVTRNGEAVDDKVQLSNGDVIGLGKHYLFLFRDPVALMHKQEGSSNSPEPTFSPSPLILCLSPPTSLSNHSAATTHCINCTPNFMDVHGWSCKPPPRKGPPFLTSPRGHILTLSYKVEDEDHIVRQIFAMEVSGNDTEGPPLTVSFLLSLCLQYASAYLHTSDLRRLLLLSASEVQSAMWECTTKLAAVYPEVKDSSPKDEECSPHEVISGLRPLVVWMANSLELLQFIQHELPLILEWRMRKEKTQKVEDGCEDAETKEAENLSMLELRLSCVHSASEETTAVLEEVILLAFQQCVYYITKLLYPVLPSILDCNPFRESPGDGGIHIPVEIRQVVEVLNDSWRLLLDCQVHPEVSSQLVGYLFYFINASLFNSLMERGSEPGFYQWSRGVRMRANLDLVLDWAHTAGLGELALEQTHTLSSAVNLLATPRKNLLQMTWASLRSDYPALTPAQLNHLLSLYSPASPCTQTWAPMAQDRAAACTTAGILESFDTHHPLELPDEGYQLQLRRPVTDPALREQLHKFKGFITMLSDSHRNASDARNNQMKEAQDGSDKRANDEALNSAGDDEILSQVLPSSPSFLYQDELNTGGETLAAQERTNPKLIETSESKRSSLEHPSLVTPPQTPHTAEMIKAHSETFPPSSHSDREGGLVSECLAALNTDHLKPDCRLVGLKEEEEENEEEETDNDDEVFSLELEKGERGLGLALVDTTNSCTKVRGIFIRAVVPDSPAAKCKKLEPGDRILAVNGVSLLGLDYDSGKELIQSSGARLRLLVARSHLMAAASQTEC
ncbi:ras-associating and dilute domain-containing protein isoform X1 [Cyprinodon tularosa]|uniref:ras-associating and dilute domain-containing protein isoform X1 n=2 Tax=Cyprinodon tularosa TaxID=77115 RepID=UPI0018E241C6|nr:ras-associating and dilute domain-containing protein isoform X1 [Cyprinodon tularosa]